MLIPLQTIFEKYRPKISGVLHVGAHLGEEAADYNAFGCRPVTWIEANPELIPQLTENVTRYRGRVVQAMVGEVSGDKRPFIVTNNGQSSSMLELHRHKQISPEVWEVGRQEHVTITIDDLVDDRSIPPFNFVNLDIQGAELLALKGAHRCLQQVDYIYSEINTWEIYAECARVWDLDELLAPVFVRVETSMTPVGWGDGFFVRRPE